MEKMKQKIFNAHSKEEGITLISLIITVIILVILSAVAISTIYKNKMVEYAIDGSQDYVGEAIKENKIIDKTTTIMDSTVEKIGEMVSGKINTPGVEVTKPSDWTNSNVTAIADGAGNKLPLPKEFYYIGGDLNTGIVISDRKEDTLESSGVEMR